MSLHRYFLLSRKTQVKVARVHLIKPDFRENYGPSDALLSPYDRDFDYFLWIRWEDTLLDYERNRKWNLRVLDPMLCNFSLWSAKVERWNNTGLRKVPFRVYSIE